MFLNCTTVVVLLFKLPLSVWGGLHCVIVIVIVISPTVWYCNCNCSTAIVIYMIGLHCVIVIVIFIVISHTVWYCNCSCGATIAVRISDNILSYNLQLLFAWVCPPQRRWLNTQHSLYLLYHNTKAAGDHDSDDWWRVLLRSHSRSVWFNTKHISSSIIIFRQLLIALPAGRAFTPCVMVNIFFVFCSCSCRG